MRRVSKKRARLNRKVQPIRDAYRWEFPQCQVPWCKADATELHEISRGAGRGASLGIRAALLHLCRFDHGQMDVLPVAGQLALKAIGDPDGYCRVTVNRLRNRADDSITAEEVAWWIDKLKEVDEPNLGPQKQPYSIRQIQAQRLRTLRDLNGS